MNRIETKTGQSNIFKDIFLLFLGSRILIGAIAFLSNLVITKSRFGIKTSNILELFYKWDSLWFMSIVQNGYQFIEGRQSNIAFFPLYPLIVKIFTFYTSNPTIILAVGFLLSNLFTFLSCIYLYKIIRLEYADSVAFKAVLLLLLFPVSFFISIFYSEGLFLFLIIASFYYARIKNWRMMAVFAFMLPLTRSIGVFAIIPLLVEYYDLSFSNVHFTKKFVKETLKKTKSNILYFASIPLGALVYVAYMVYRYGDPLIYIKAQEPWNTKFSTFLATWNNTGLQEPFYMITNRATMILAITLTIYMIFKKVRLSYIIFMMVFLFFYLSANSLQSTPRFITVLFPLYLGLALYMNKSRVREYLVITASVMLLTLMTTLFVNGYLLT